MSKSRMGAPKRVAAGLVAGALAVAGLAFTAAPAGAVANVTEQRIEGADRFETAANVCDSVAPTGAANVLLATGRLSFADALTASGLAGDRNTCILLTEQDSLPPATSAQLTQMKSLGTPLTSVTILGGLVAVGQAVQDQVTALGGLTVDRIDGTDRFDTARDTATAIGTPGAIAGAGTVILANGENRLNGADAMAVGPVAARGDGTNPFPILLTNQNDIPTPTLEALAAPGVDNVIVLGGTDAISDAVATQAGTAAGDTTVTRVQGPTREDTSVAIAGLALEQGLAVTEVFLANGRIGMFSADALVSGPLGDVRGAATLLTSGMNTLGTAAQTYLDANSNRITTVTAIGGTDVIAQTVLDAAEAAAEMVSNDTDQVIAVSPNTAVVNNVSTSATDNTGSRTYTVSGLDSTKLYDIAIANVATGAVAVGSDGSVTFADTNTNNQADVTDGTTVPGNAIIEVVNGVGAGAIEVNNVVPNAGSIVFTVDSQGFDQIMPVVWTDTDAGNNNALNLVVPTPANANPKRAAEPFGLGGAISFVPGEAAEGNDPAASAVQFVDKEANFFVANNLRYNYDSTDIFQYNGGVVSAEQFEAALSVGDTIDPAVPAAGYSRIFQNTFNLVTDTPAVPTAVTVSTIGDLDAENDAFDARFMWTAPNPPNGLIASYDVEVTTDNPATTACETGGTVVNTTADADPQPTTQTRNDLTNGTYCVRVRSVSAQTGTSAYTTSVPFTVQKGDLDTAAPTIANTTLNEAGGAVAVTIDGNDIAGGGGDVITIQFTEAMDTTATVAGTTRIRFTDPTGEIFEILLAAGDTGADGEATFVWGNYTPAGGTAITNGQLTITLVDEPVKVGGPTPAAGVGTAEIPSDITAFTANSLQDVGGNDVDLSGSADRTIDNEL